VSAGASEKSRRKYMVIARGEEARRIIEEWKKKGISMPRRLNHFITDPETKKNVRTGFVIVKTHDDIHLYCINPHQNVIYYVLKRNITGTVRHKIKPGFPDDYCRLCSQYWRGECRFGLPPLSKEEEYFRGRGRGGYLALCIEIPC